MVNYLPLSLEQIQNRTIFLSTTPSEADRIADTVKEVVRGQLKSDQYCCMLIVGRRMQFAWFKRTVPFFTELDDGDIVSVPIPGPRTIMNFTNNGMHRDHLIRCIHKVYDVPFNAMQKASRSPYVV